MLLLDGSGFLKALRISDRSIVSLFAATGATVVEQTESYTVLFADGSSGRKLVRIDMSLNVSTLTDSVFTREVIPACLPAVNRYICQSAGTFLSVDKSGGATKFFLPITDGLIVPVPSTWKLTGDTVWYTVSNGHNRGIRSVLEDGAEDSIDLSRVLYGMVNMKAAQSDLARALFQQDDWKAPYLQTIHKDNGLEIVDGRNHEVVVSYGSLPTLSTPRLIAYVMPFYRAFETGHPQLVQVIGVAPTGTFIELFMVNGNQPGISRVTSFIP